MPFYDFCCKKCGHKFSKMLPMGSAQAECHLCGSEAKKLISAPAVHFSGSGFYSSDNRKPSVPSSAKKEETANAEKPKTQEKKDEKTQEKKEV